MNINKFAEALALSAIEQAYEQGFIPLLAPVVGIYSHCDIATREEYYNYYPLCRECMEALIGMTYAEFCDLMPALYADFVS